MPRTKAERAGRAFLAFLLRCMAPGARGLIGGEMEKVTQLLKLNPPEK